MSSFVKSKSFKYAKNLIIGVGAAVVLMGALFKLQSWPYASEMLIIGLSVEALIFLMLGVLGPDKDYYWEKLYPGLSDYESNIAPLTAGDLGEVAKPLNADAVEANLSGMLEELKTMSTSLGSLKALQEIDFSDVSISFEVVNDLRKDFKFILPNDCHVDSKGYLAVTEDVILAEPRNNFTVEMTNVFSSYLKQNGKCRILLFSDM